MRTFQPALARALRHHPHALLPLDTLALLIHVHLRTLHAAAKDGRCVLQDRGLAESTPVPLCWDTAPSDCAVRIRNLRQQLGMTLTEFATQVGAACKAVVYQWESQKRCPSPLFWQRIQALEAVARSSLRGSDCWP